MRVALERKALASNEEHLLRTLARKMSLAENEQRNVLGTDTE